MNCDEGELKTVQDTYVLNMGMIFTFTNPVELFHKMVMEGCMGQGSIESVVGSDESLKGTLQYYSACSKVGKALHNFIV
ncbi:hypothetical protein E2C01_041636 [Portunus trituberculatus]|uniref:Uncharacterized protein n=1 Tax=Portunus trituberculatus TaxID=210409 RepID=A0A5B7FR88_PORTR|nr:hypothetical protein [Portunus trituberculatus]